MFFSVVCLNLWRRAKVFSDLSKRPPVRKSFFFLTCWPLSLKEQRKENKTVSLTSDSQVREVTFLWICFDLILDVFPGELRQTQNTFNKSAVQHQTATFFTFLSTKQWRLNCFWPSVPLSALESLAPPRWSRGVVCRWSCGRPPDQTKGWQPHAITLPPKKKFQVSTAEGARSLSSLSSYLSVSLTVSEFRLYPISSLLNTHTNNKPQRLKLRGLQMTQLVGESRHSHKRRHNRQISSC